MGATAGPGAIRILEVGGGPDEMGGAHGAAYGPEIRAYCSDRTALAVAGTDWGRTEILALAEQLVPAHEAYDAALYAEMLAMADAAGVTPAEAVVVGGYTDFIDVVRAAAGGTAVEDACTAVIVPDALAAGAGLLAQTWDMHASATPHVILLSVAPVDAPAALVFTTVGTLGQIGMNEAGIAVGINNLTVADGRPGVTWPFVVRKALRQTDFDDAVKCVLDAPLAGGHNFLLFDSAGRGVSIEATPTATHVSRLADEPLFHTNHCLAPTTRAVEGERPADLQASSVTRLADAAGLLGPPPVTPEALMALTADQGSICRRPAGPDDYETSGAVVMRPATAEMWPCWGNPADHPYSYFRVGGTAP